MFRKMFFVYNDSVCSMRAAKEGETNAEPNQERESE